jgi:hypothetical protein
MGWVRMALPIPVAATVSDLTTSFTIFLLFFLVSTGLELKLRVQHKREVLLLHPAQLYSFCYPSLTGIQLAETYLGE